MLKTELFQTAIKMNLLADLKGFPVHNNVTLFFFFCILEKQPVGVRWGIKTPFVEKKRHN